MPELGKQLPEPFVDDEGTTWVVQSHVRTSAGGTVFEGWLRFLAGGRVLSAGPIVLAEERDALGGWEILLTRERLAKALREAKFDGAFSRAARAMAV